MCCLLQRHSPSRTDRLNHKSTQCLFRCWFGICVAAKTPGTDIYIWHNPSPEHSLVIFRLKQSSREGGAPCATADRHVDVEPSCAVRTRLKSDREPCHQGGGWSCDLVVRYVSCCWSSYGGCSSCKYRVTTVRTKVVQAVLVLRVP